jgi:hypothetical protein
MAAGVAKHLPRFAAAEPDVFGDAARLAPLGMARPQKPVAQLAAEAEERGRLAGREEAAAELARARAADREELARELAEARRQHEAAIAALGDRLAGDLAAGLAAIAARIADDVARVLAPFLHTAVRERACDEIAETTLALLHSAEHLSLTLSGPADLVARLSARLGGRPHRAEVTDGEPELRVTVDDTAIQTRIAAWSERLAAAAEAPHG